MLSPDEIRTKAADAAAAGRHAREGKERDAAAAQQRAADKFEAAKKLAIEVRQQIIRPTMQAFADGVGFGNSPDEGLRENATWCRYTGIDCGPNQSSFRVGAIVGFGSGELEVAVKAEQFQGLVPDNVLTIFQIVKRFPVDVFQRDDFERWLAAQAYEASRECAAAGWKGTPR